MGSQPGGYNVSAMFIAIFAAVLTVVAGALAGGSIFLSRGIRALKTRQALKGVAFTVIGAVFTIPSSLWLLALVWTGLSHLFQTRTN